MEETRCKAGSGRVMPLMPLVLMWACGWSADDALSAACLCLAAVSPCCRILLLACMGVAFGVGMCKWGRDTVPLCLVS